MWKNQYFAKVMGIVMESLVIVDFVTAIMSKYAPKKKISKNQANKVRLLSYRRMIRMNEKELIERLLDLAISYYTEKTKGEFEGEIAYKIPEDQPERQFIQEVMTTCSDLLEKYE